MPDIVLTTLNARYIHASFGLRYLFANLEPEQRARASLLEFVIKDEPHDIVEEILASDPRLVGFGVYIWNVVQTTAVVKILKRLRPDVVVVLGGPEVSYETEGQAIVGLADVVICGEADVELPKVIRRIFDGKVIKEKIIRAMPPVFGDLALPYDYYSDVDVANRVVYVEASRGCPFRCEFCLSSLPGKVRKPDLDVFMAAMERLLERGVRHFKFVDRTFNLDLKSASRILTFFLERYQAGMLIHFEMIPDRLPEALRETIARFPPGALQFEVGVQTLDPEVERRISRRQDHDRLADNLAFLRSETGVHVHADLIIGLPGEDVDTFALGFDRLLAMGPQEIQVGVLKRLKGTPIVRHDEAFSMVYSPTPPFAVLETGAVDYATMRRLLRFVRVWDTVANSGNFPRCSRRLWLEASSPFFAFWAFAEAWASHFGRTHAVALRRQVEYLFSYLIGTLGQEEGEVARDLFADYATGGRNDVPVCLRPHLTADFIDVTRRAGRPQRDNPAAARQARHKPVKQGQKALHSGSVS